MPVWRKAHRNSFIHSGVKQKRIRLARARRRHSRKEDNMLLATAAANPTMMIVLYVVIFGGIFYFMGYRPQKKEKKRVDEMMASLAIGDSVLTSSGFYGVIIDMTDDTVIVEFGSNKNCRIPMQKAAIVQVEKPEA